MSENYTPGDNALQVAPYTTVLLSQRDLSLRVPINFVTTPGVSLTAACFTDNRYEDDSSANCLSNLLSIGFRRFVIDLYWDESRNVWSFCPVAIPASIPDLSPFSTLTISSNTTTSSSSSSLASGTSSFTFTTSTSSSTNRALQPRQDTTSTTTSSLSSFSTSVAILADSSLSNILPSITSIPDLPTQPFVSIGPYVCTTTINLSVFYTQFLDYIQKTENTLQAHLIYLILNIHASSSTNSPNSPAPEPSNLPTGSNLLGYQFMANLSDFVYTRTNLFSDRSNLNSSWYGVSREIYTPVEGYYQTVSSAEGILSTEDGWPSESYIELARSKRLLLGWGTVDPQMAGYNFSGDSDIIFPNGFIEDVETNVSATADGNLTSGCFFRNDTVDLAKTNSSWAVSTTVPDFNYPITASADINPLLDLTQITTSCGISAQLNNTLLSVPAFVDPVPYQSFSYATIWSWAPNEPRNTSDLDSDVFRCAISNRDLSGRWIVDDCTQKRYAACRARGQPYNWTLTPITTPYNTAERHCPQSYDFAVPRTALENSYRTYHVPVISASPALRTVPLLSPASSQ
ncbi:Lectin C-type domain protein [Diplocarpon rosae]|nr:Lectin C-type domain protein [Diplocarpon rosae]